MNQNILGKGVSLVGLIAIGYWVTLFGLVAEMVGVFSRPPRSRPLR